MDIVEELRKDRENGAKRLVSEYKAGLMSLARRFYKNESDAEELVNATFAKVVANIDDYLEQSAFFAWMCQILTNEFRDSVKRKSNKVEVYPGTFPDIADEGAQEKIFCNLDHSLLRDAIETLPREMKEAIMLHYIAEQPVPVVARFLRLPISTVKWRLHVARKELARRLGAGVKDAVRKPGVKAILLALLLCGITALGAGVAALVGTPSQGVRSGPSRVASRMSSSASAEAYQQATSDKRQAEDYVATQSAADCSRPSATENLSLTTQGEQNMNISRTKRAALTSALGAGALALAAAANADTEYFWRGTAGNPVWDDTSPNWALYASDASGTTTFVNDYSSSYGSFDGGGAADVTVTAGGVTANDLIGYAGAANTFRGGPIAAKYIEAYGGNLALYNEVTTSFADGQGLLMRGGSITVGAGGILDSTFIPWNDSTYDSRLTILTNGTLKVRFHSWWVNDSGNKATLYFDGGTFIHTENRDQPFGGARFLLGAGGLHFQEATASAETWSRLPGPIGTDETLPTDGGIIVDSHEGYMLLPNHDCTYRGGLHIAGTGGHIGVRADGNLGAAPAAPTDNIFFEAAGASSILIGHGGGVTLDANRRLRIADGARARIGSYDSGSSLTVNGTISCEDPENGILATYPYSQSATSFAGPVTLDPGDGNTNILGRLWIGQPTVIASGTTFLMNTNALSESMSGTSADQEEYGTNYGSPLNISGGGRLAVTGGELRAAGSRPISQSASLTISGGLVDFDGHEILHAAAETWMPGGESSVPAITTVKDGGRLYANTIRMAGNGNRTDASKSVLNIETGGLVRVKGSLYIAGSQPDYAATVNFNGGTLEWARTHNSWMDSPYGNDNPATQGNIAYNVLEGGMNITNDVEMWFYPAITSGVGAGETDGGLTKWGTGLFALMNTGNTFNGPVTVMQGTGSIGADGAIPATGTVRVNGGAQFSLNNHSQSISRIEGSGSFAGVQNGGTKFLSVTSAIAPGMGADAPGTITIDGPINIADGTALEIDVASDGTGDCLSYPDNLDLSKLRLVVNDGTKLNKNHTYAIVSVAQGMSVQNQFASEEGLPRTWNVKYRADCVELHYANPFTLIVQ